ncbi:MAG: MFS transporter [Acidovorax sp.]|uniref:MFS transporter n=1 Tax=Acidovorax sp. TaxID=1872122 RepID=UPI0039E3A741
MAHAPLPTGPVVTYSPEDEAMFSKISWRLLPLLVACYIIAFLDRVNIGFAQLQMRETLAFSDAAYAFGAGVFFIGYFLCEVPSNLILEKIGARKTLLRIMFCWGVVASCMMFVQSAGVFYVLRFLLGAFEAGFFPGIILYLTYWYPGPRRGKVIAVFMTGATIAYLLAGPLSGAIMKYMDGLMGYRGWQWLFVTQGLPASILGIVAYLYFKDKPEDANWLTASEKTRLRKLLDEDAAAVGHGASHGSLRALMGTPQVWVMSLVYFLFLGATYVMVFWTPTLIKGWGVKDVFTVGLLSSIGPAVTIFAMVLIGRSSDRHNERRKHFMFCCTLSAIGALILIFTQGTLALSVLGLIVLTIGQSSSTPLFFTATSEVIPKKIAAGGIALVSSLGNLGPAVMPSVVSFVNTSTGTPVASLYLVAALWLVSGVILMLAVRPRAAAPSARLAAA